MTPLGWVAIAGLAAAVVWLGLAMVGAVRELDALRERVDSLEVGPLHIPEGLPVGSPTPAWELESADGVAVSSSTFEGRRHLLVFVDAGCGACEELVPAVRGTGAAEFPPAIVLERGDGGADRAADAFHISVVPHVIVVDEGGFIVAQGGAATLDDVRTLLVDAAGIRVVAHGSA